MSNKKLLFFICCYAICLFLFSFFIVPTTDSYYYFTWSQNLQLSYLDGPPLIAYLLNLSTHLFGYNFFAIELVSLLSVYGSAFLIYKIVCLYNEKSTALLSSCLLLVYPFSTTRFVSVSMTLDGLELITSLLLIYTSMLWIKYKKNTYIYYIGLSIGISLLAKYNNIILISGIAIYFVLNKDLRKIFCLVHVYISILISLLIFLPVIIWNYQHHWISFIYQLTSHKWNGDIHAINSSLKYGIRGVWFYLSSCVFGVLNIFLILLIYFRYIKKIIITSNHYNNLLIFIIYFIILFWLLESYTSHIGLNYLVSCSSILIILVSQQLAKFNNGKLIYFLLILFTFSSTIMLIDKSRIHKQDVYNYNKYVKSGILNRFIINF